jgi:hypothetical protein
MPITVFTHVLAHVLPTFLRGLFPDRIARMVITLTCAFNLQTPGSGANQPALCMNANPGFSGVLIPATIADRDARLERFGFPGCTRLRFGGLERIKSGLSAQTGG